MPSRLKKSIVAAAAAIALAALAACDAGCRSGQTGESATDRPYRAPRTADGKPNLNGIWQALNSANWDIQGHAAQPSPFPELLGALGAVPPGQGVVEGNEIPYQPWALAKKKENFEKRLAPESFADVYNRNGGDPEARCYLPGVPRATYMPFPFQIVQTPKYILIAYEYAVASRTIMMDSTEKSPVESWMGWSRRALGGRNAGGRRERLQRKYLVRPGRQFPQRSLACGRAVHAHEPVSPPCTKRPSKTRKCSPGPGRSACRSIAGWRRTFKSWNSSAWSLPSPSCTRVSASRRRSELSFSGREMPLGIGPGGIRSRRTQRQEKGEPGESAGNNCRLDSLVTSLE